MHVFGKFSRRKSGKPSKLGGTSCSRCKEARVDVSPEVIESGFHFLTTPGETETQGWVITPNGEPLGLSLSWGSQKVEPPRLTLGSVAAVLPRRLVARRIPYWKSVNQKW